MIDDPLVLFVEEKDAGQRVDRFLKEQFALKSRSFFEKLLEKGSVHLNDRVCKKREIVQKGDEITLHFSLEDENVIKAEDIPLDILYEDEEIIAINKPAHMVVHPAPGHYEHTFLNALLFYLKKGDLKKEGSLVSTLRPGIVHRLDKETTGVLLAAKNDTMQASLQSLFQQRAIEKDYFAIIHGSLKEQTVSQPIKRDPIERKKMRVDPAGKEAITSFFPIKQKGGVSLVRAVPKTGRTHQIRVHLRHLFHPIVGDKLYGMKDKAKRHYLHASSLSFIHPKTKEKVRIEAPYPEDMATLLFPSDLP